MKDEEMAPAIEVSASQGVQAGAGNVMYNAWLAKQPLDPVSLSALTPHTAVDRLQQLSHDELVDFFAGAKPGDVSEILAAFLEADEAKVLATLANINRRKAMDLIGTVPNADTTLTALPDAAEAIARKAATLKWKDGSLLHRWGDNSGYVREYRNGHIFWSRRHGVRTTVGVIDQYCTVDRKTSALPIGDEETAPTSPFGTVGIRQAFQIATVYSSKHGTYYVRDEQSYEAESESGGWLGFPVGEVEKISGLGQSQQFEGGNRYTIQGGARSTFSVRGQVLEVLRGKTFLPMSIEVAAESSSGASGRVQQFQLLQNGSWHKTAVYASENDGTIIVDPEIWSYYQELGAETSRLGFPSLAPEIWRMPVYERRADSGIYPTAMQYRVPDPDPDIDPDPDLYPRQPQYPTAGHYEVPSRSPWSGTWPKPEPMAVAKILALPKTTAVQFFEGGVVYWQINTGAFAVTSPVFETIAPELQLRDELGWPVSEALPIGPGETNWIQFFNNGNVTFRNGKCEISLRQVPHVLSLPRIDGQG